MIPEISGTYTKRTTRTSLVRVSLPIFRLQRSAQKRSLPIPEVFSTEFAVYAEIPEVGLKFRFSPAFALLSMAILPFFGTPFAVIAVIYGVGMLGLSAGLGLPKSVDLVFGLVLTMFVFAAQFLAAAFLAIQAGGNQIPVVAITGVLWFIQLAAFATDLKLFSTSIVMRVESDLPAATRRKPRRQSKITKEFTSTPANALLRR